MPIYEYKCDVCGHEFEEMLHFSEREVPLNTPCPNRIFDRNQEPQCFDCDGKVHLKMSLGSFHLKGDGWAKDGYGKRKMSKEEKIERSTVKTTSTNSQTGETKVVSEKPLEARSLVDD
jgi:predicted nucleic acid-binding Zn ribbon protein